MKKRFMPILLGCDENAYGFGREFHEKYGITPIAMANTMLEQCRKTKILDIIIDTRLHDPDYLIDKLNSLGKKLKKEYEKVFLVPLADAYLEILSAHRDELKIFENRFLDLSVLQKFNDKKSFYAICEKYDLSYPKSSMCNKNNYEKVINDLSFSYPLILKPNNSNSFKYLDASFEGKEKVYFIEDKEILKQKINNIYSSSYDDELIIQEYVRGDDACMRTLNTYSDKNGTVKIMSLGQPVLEEYHPSTFGNYAAILTKTEFEPYMEKIASFLNDIHYVGPANFDIKIDAKTGKYYIFEINPRVGRSSFYTSLGGASVLDAFVKDLVDGSLEEKVANDTEYFWTNVPKYLIKRYVRDKEVLGKIAEMYKRHKVVHALFYKNDDVVGRLYITLKQYARKVHYFPKYFIEKK